MTTDEIKRLTDEELRIKVATLLGWKDVKPMFEQLMEPDFRSGTGERYGERVRVIGGISPYHAKKGISHYSKPPDYPRDLNVCREMEATLPDGRWESGEWVIPDGPSIAVYMCALMETTRVDSKWASIHATARQRCEAFVAVMTESQHWRK